MCVCWCVLFECHYDNLTYALNLDQRRIFHSHLLLFTKFVFYKSRPYRE